VDIFEKIYEAIEKRFSHVVYYAEDDAIACNECEHDNLSFDAINHAEDCAVLLFIKDVQTLEAAQQPDCA